VFKLTYNGADIVWNIFAAIEIRKSDLFHISIPMVCLPVMDDQSDLHVGIISDL
jgi:hypothetical protein